LGSGSAARLGVEVPNRIAAVAKLTTASVKKDRNDRAIRKHIADLLRGFKSPNRSILLAQAGF
jgi:hypothetical protein